MTITIYTVDNDSIGIEDHAQDVLLMLELPIKSPWIKVKTKYGWLWIDRSSIVKVKVFE